jgi:hypothetical protein
MTREQAINILQNRQDYTKAEVLAAMQFLVGLSFRR